MTRMIDTPADKQDGDGPNRLMLVGKEHAADRLMASQKLNASSPYLCGEEPPTPRQVSAVLHALADHTLIENMLHVAPALGAHRARLGSEWARATGVGTYFQRMGDWLDYVERPGGDAK